MLPRLQELGVGKVAEAAGANERRARDWLNGIATPHAKTKKALIDLVRNLVSDRQ